MGTYYHFAVVNDRVLIWWIEDGEQRMRWIVGSAAAALIDFISLQNCKVQGRLRDALKLAETDIYPPDWDMRDERNLGHQSGD